jgi:hypothetical protein
MCARYKLYVFMYACVCMYVHMYIHTYVYMYEQSITRCLFGLQSQGARGCARRDVSNRKYVYRIQAVCMYVCMYVHTYIYIHEYIHTYLYMYEQSITRCLFGLQSQGARGCARRGVSNRKYVCHIQAVCMYVFLYVYTYMYEQSMTRCLFGLQSQGARGCAR